MTPLHRRGVTASKTGLLLACQYWAREDVERQNDPENEAMARGTRVHEAIDRYNYGGAVSLTDTGERLMVAAAHQWIDDNGDHADRFYSEYAMGRDLVTPLGCFARCDHGAREYTDEPSPLMLWGTADLVAIESKPVIVDWKTGPTSAAGALPQLMTLAVLAGLESARLVSVELRDDGTYDEAIDVTVDAIDLEVHADALRTAILAVELDPEPTPGAHCTEEYCPARMTCPARTGAALQVATTLVPAETLRRTYDPRSPVTAETVADHAIAVDVLADWAESKKGEVAAYVLEHGPVDLGVYGTASTVKGRTIKGTLKATALAALAAAKGATDEEIEACRSESSTGKPYMQIRTKKSDAATKQRLKKGKETTP